MTMIYGMMRKNTDVPVEDNVLDSWSCGKEGRCTKVLCIFLSL